MSRQAVAKAAFPERVPYARAERLIGAALGRAEGLHQQFLAQLPEPLRISGSYARMLPSLRAFCAERLGLAGGSGSSWDPLRPLEAPQSSSSSPGREASRAAQQSTAQQRSGSSSGSSSSGSSDELEAEMARALLHLWLHFDEECAARAAEVGSFRSHMCVAQALLPVLWPLRNPRRPSNKSWACLASFHCLLPVVQMLVRRSGVPQLQELQACLGDSRACGGQATMGITHIARCYNCCYEAAGFRGTTCLVCCMRMCQG